MLPSVLFFHPVLSTSTCHPSRRQSGLSPSSNSWAHLLDASSRPAVSYASHSPPVVGRPDPLPDVFFSSLMPFSLFADSAPRIKMRQRERVSRILVISLFIRHAVTQIVSCLPSPMPTSKTRLCLPLNCLTRGVTIPGDELGSRAATTVRTCARESGFAERARPDFPLLN